MCTCSWDVHVFMERLETTLGTVLGAWSFLSFRGFLTSLELVE